MFRDKRTVPLDDVQIPADASASPDYALVEGMLQEVNARLLHEALLKLADNQRISLCLHYGMDPDTFEEIPPLSNEEIANKLNTTLAAVRGYQTRGRAELKKLLGPNLEF